MIRFNDDWVIDVDAYNYILKRDLHKMEKSRDGKSMVPAYNTVGYYGSLRKALEHLREEIIRDKLRDGTHPPLRGFADHQRLHQRVERSRRKDHERMKPQDLPLETKLIQLAEEASELSQACLKLVRCRHGDTPVPEMDAKMHLLEELADVALCSKVITSKADDRIVKGIMMQKELRWEERLNGKK